MLGHEVCDSFVACHFGGGMICLERCEECDVRNQKGEYLSTAEPCGGSS